MVEGDLLQLGAGETSNATPLLAPSSPAPGAGSGALRALCTPELSAPPCLALSAPPGFRNDSLVPGALDGLLGVCSLLVGACAVSGSGSSSWPPPLTCRPGAPPPPSAVSCRPFRGCEVGLGAPRRACLSEAFCPPVHLGLSPLGILSVLRLRTLSLCSRQNCPRLARHSGTPHGTAHGPVRCRRPASVPLARTGGGHGRPGRRGEDSLQPAPPLPHVHSGHQPITHLPDRCIYVCTCAFTCLCVGMHGCVHLSTGMRVCVHRSVPVCGGGPL